MNFQEAALNQFNDGFRGKAHLSAETINDSDIAYTLTSYGSIVALASVHVCGSMRAIDVTLRCIDDYATCTTRRHLKAFGDFLDDVTSGYSRHISVKADFARPINLRYGKQGLFHLVELNEHKNVCELITEMLRDYPLPSTILRYEHAHNARNQCVSYAEYARLCDMDNERPVSLSKFRTV